jgi:prepilin signal peptidase PulO-like enzyme (type II secretory pathway)
MIAYALLGLLLGPALNLAIERLPRRRPLFAGRPRCAACGAALGARELLPALGWALQRGRCRSCAGRLPVRALLVELAFPLACAALWWRDGWGPLLAVHTAAVAFFLVVLCIDLEHRLVLNRMTGPGLLAALACAALGLGPSLRAAALGAAVGFLFLFAPAVLLPGLGMGDVKLAAVIGAVVGFPGVLTALFAGVLCGGVASALLLLTRRAGRRSTIAYAPYLVAGVLLVLFGLVQGGAG